MSDAPTDDDLESALDTLLWLHENSNDGRLRDEISHVRAALDDELESR